MITKETVIGRRDFDEFGNLSVRRDTWFLEDGVRVGEPQYHRVVYAPGDAIDHEDPSVKRLTATEWTPDVVAKAKQRRDEALRQMTERR